MNERQAPAADQGQTAVPEGTTAAFGRGLGALLGPVEDAPTTRGPFSSSLSTPKKSSTGPRHIRAKTRAYRRCETLDASRRCSTTSFAGWLLTPWPVNPP